MGQVVRIGAVVAVLGLVAAFVAVSMGEFNFARFAERYVGLAERIAEYPVISTLIGIGIYTVLVISLLPGVPLLSAPFGLVYGWGAGTLVVLAGTAAGTIALYFATLFLLPAQLGGRVGSLVDRLADRIKRNMISTMLVLRLMPPVPFTLLNLALPSLKVPLLPYLWTTLAGMAPRLLVYALAGEGLRVLIDQQIEACTLRPGEPCELDLSASDFLTTEIVVATVLLAVVAAVPLVWQWIGARGERQEPTKLP